MIATIIVSITSPRFQSVHENLGIDISYIIYTLPPANLLPLVKEVQTL
jgi:hypothetical protein